MSIKQCKSMDNNYYTKTDHAQIYVDYTNSRIKIVKFDNISIQNIKRIIYFASKQRIGKVICNCDIKETKKFTEAEFLLEGKIDGFFNGEDAFCMSYFTSSSRKLYRNEGKEQLLLMNSLSANNTFIYRNDRLKYRIRNANENDINGMIDLFSETFFTYPFPICDAEYLKKTMNKRVLYKVAVDNNKIISVAAADLDEENLNAEITDCATYSCYRGQGILSNIIYNLEEDLRNMGYITLYSLSRAANPSINLVLSKQDYKYRGKLINNCNICGGFENMNIWVKNINSNPCIKIN